MSERPLRPERMRGKRASLLAGLLFAGLAGAILHQALLPGKTLVPLDLIQTLAPWDSLDLGPLANPLISDPFYSFYPRRAVLTTALRAGELPLWNPAILTGSPAIANPNFQLFYPPNLLAAFWLEPATALPWLAWAHLTLTGWLMFHFLRRHQLRWLAAWLGGAVWLLNGVTLVWLENPHRLSTSAWLPGIFWGYELAFAGRRRLGIALGAGCLGLAILGGQMQFVLAAGLLFGLYGLARWRLARASWRELLPPVALGLLGLALGAIAILPASQLAVASQRIQFDSQTILGTRWPVVRLFHLLVPDHLGNPVDTVGYWGPANYAETAAYFGAVSLLLILSGLIRWPWPPLGWIGLLGMGVALAVTLGSSLARLVPLLPGGQFIALSRWLILLPLTGSWLVAVGMDGWLGATSRSPRLALAATFSLLLLLTALVAWQAEGEQASYVFKQAGRTAFLLLVAAILLWQLPRWPIAPYLLVVLVIADLWQWGYDFNPVGDTAYLYPETEIIELLRQDEGLFRVQPLQAGKVVFGPNVLSVYGLQESGGYTPLIDGDYAALFRGLAPDVAIGWMRPNRNMLVASQPNPRLGLLNVKYFLAADELDEGVWAAGDGQACTTAIPLTVTPWRHTFMVPAAGFNRLDLQLVSVSGPATLRVQLWQADRQLVLQSELSLESGAEPQLLPFFLAPVAGSQGQQFTLELTMVAGEASLCGLADERPAMQLFGSALRRLAQTENGLWLYENQLALPRAFVVHHLVVTADPLAQLLAEDHDWHYSAVLAAPLPVELAEEPLPSTAAVAIERYERHDVAIRVNTPQPGLLVLADQYAPGWVAQLDGDATPIYETNLVQRGVLIPAGEHLVTFAYRPVALYQGGAISLVALLLILTLLGSDLWPVAHTKQKKNNHLTAGES